MLRQLSKESLCFQSNGRVIIYDDNGGTAWPPAIFYSDDGQKYDEFKYKNMNRLDRENNITFEDPRDKSQGAWPLQGDTLIVDGVSFEKGKSPTEIETVPLSKYRSTEGLFQMEDGPYILVTKADYLYIKDSARFFMGNGNDVPEHYVKECTPYRGETRIYTYTAGDLCYPPEHMNDIISPILTTYDQDGTPKQHTLQRLDHKKFNIVVTEIGARITPIQEKNHVEPPSPSVIRIEPVSKQEPVNNVPMSPSPPTPTLVPKRNHQISPRNRENRKETSDPNLITTEWQRFSTYFSHLAEQQPKSANNITAQIFSAYLLEKDANRETFAHTPLLAKKIAYYMVANEPKSTNPYREDQLRVEYENGILLSEPRELIVATELWVDNNVNDPNQRNEIDKATIGPVQVQQDRKLSSLVDTLNSKWGKETTSQKMGKEYYGRGTSEEEKNTIATLAVERLRQALDKNTELVNTAEMHTMVTHVLPHLPFDVIRTINNSMDHEVNYRSSNVGRSR